MVLGEMANRVYRLRIVVDGTRPEVWRRVEVPAGFRLDQLHLVIQAVMGWEDTNRHGFGFGGTRYGEGWALKLGTADRDEYEAVVGEVLDGEGSRGVYTYDFRNDWRHLIVVEAVGAAEVDVFYPRVLDGHGSCPPEGCGGVERFEHLRYLRDHPDELDGEGSEAEEQSVRVGSLGPDELDREAIQQELDDVFGGVGAEGGEPLSDEDLPPARAVSLLPEEELAVAAVESSPLRELLALARWVSPDKRLTGTGVPRPDDVRAAVEGLDLWPRASAAEAEERAERVRRMRAARDLPEFLDLWRSAVDLGLIEVRAGKAHTSSELLAGEPPADRVLAWWTELFEAAVGGPLEDGESRFGQFSDLELVHVLLRTLYEAPDEFEADLAELMRAMAGNVAGQVGGAEGSGATTGTGEVGDLLARYSLPVLYRTMLRIVEGGGVRLVDATPDEVRRAVLDRVPFGLGPDADRPAPAIDCSAVLTPLGRYGVRQILLRTGVPAPLHGELAGADAAELLDALSAMPPELYSAETAPWLAGRTPAEAARQLVEAASELTGAGAIRRAIGSEVLSSAGEAILQELRLLLGSERPEVSGLAAGALLAAPGLAEEERAALHIEFGPWMAIDRMSGPLGLGEEHFVHLLGLTSAEDAQSLGQALVGGADQMWQVNHPATIPVLEALGRLHPDKRAAKAARRAAHKARSRG